MKKLNIAFMWHMHQPMYKDLVADRYYLPWVRLHALKGYYDMPALLSSFPEVKATFNLTPSLIMQLEDYMHEDEPHEDFLIISRKRVDDLTNDDKHFLLKNFFMNNWQRIIKPHPRYGELLRKRGMEYEVRHASHVMQLFTGQDYLDLQVLFNLSWFGYMFEKKHPELTVLKKKERNYTESDKLKVLSFQKQALHEILPMYKQLQSDGHIEVTTTPLYHPILPLLDRGGEEAGYEWKDDAAYHVDRAMALYEGVFSQKARGMWPSEGSVSRSILPHFLRHDVQWLATDEDILFESLGNKKRMQTLYRPYTISHEGKSIYIVFRDKRLSDLIGFSYANSDPEHAAKDFMSHLESIRHAVSGLHGEHLVSIILDGENAWEYYRDGGEGFLSRIYEQIQESDEYQAVTFSDFLQKNHKYQELYSLHAGSWINHNFDIWYGHDEDKKAWEYIEKTRDYLLTADCSEDIRRKAWEEIYIAQGSDWFWWFGDEFASSTDDVFDHLFRMHLKNVYELTGHSIPHFLNEPIKSCSRMKLEQEPRAFMYPVIDGRVTNFYEWENAGIYTFNDVLGSMHSAQKSFEKLFFGFNLSDLFFRIDFPNEKVLHSMRACVCAIDVHTPVEHFRIQFALDKDPALTCVNITNSTEQVSATFSGIIAFEKMYELRCSFKDFRLKPQEKMQFSVAIVEDNIVKERWPKYEGIPITVPTSDFEDSMWSA